MLPLHQYLQIRRRIDRQAAWIVPLLLGAIVLTYGAVFGFTTWLGSATHQDNPGWSDWQRGLLAFCGTLSPLVVAIAIINRFGIRPRDIVKFQCPACGQPLLDNTGIIVATGKCPLCLKYALKVTPLPPVDANKMLTIAQLQRVKRSQFRAQALGLLWFMFGWLGFILVAAAGALLGPDLFVENGEPSPLWGPSLLYVIFFGGLTLAAVLYSWRLMVRCPSCGTLIGAVSTVIASGNCPRCSIPIVKDATPYSEYRPLPKLAAVELARGRHSLRILGWLLTGALMCAILFGAASGFTSRSPTQAKRARLSTAILI